ncbi:MAG: hypothetical protein Q4Q58_07075 [Thermoplasmata archaeon]|nr:hypothetical protein [Thermoplasmata archaeon]
MSKSDFSKDSTQTTLYKDTISDLNLGYRDLLMAYNEGDYAVSYLRTFEMILSLNLPDMTLWQYDEYKRLDGMLPLPVFDDEHVTGETFRAYMRVYEVLMRKVGLIDKDPQARETVSDLDMVML